MVSNSHFHHEQVIREASDGELNSLLLQQENAIYRYPMHILETRGRGNSTKCCHMALLQYGNIPVIHLT